MTPKEQLIQELRHTPESAIRAELSVHGIFPSDFIAKDILINILVATYFD